MESLKQRHYEEFREKKVKERTKKKVMEEFHKIPSNLRCVTKKEIKRREIECDCMNYLLFINN